VFAIIYYGSWLCGVTESGEAITSDWVRDARRFNTEDQADRFCREQNVDYSGCAVVQVKL
jgi:hypothetical protein